MSQSPGGTKQDGEGWEVEIEGCREDSKGTMSVSSSSKALNTIHVLMTIDSPKNLFDSSAWMSNGCF